jgi:hypothetical protein
MGIISEPLLNEEPNEFRKGRSFMDSIFTIQQHLEKHTEYNVKEVKNYPCTQAMEAHMVVRRRGSRIF